MMIGCKLTSLLNLLNVFNHDDNSLFSTVALYTFFFSLCSLIFNGQFSGSTIIIISDHFGQNRECLALLPEKGYLQ